CKVSTGQKTMLLLQRLFCRVMSVMPPATPWPPGGRVKAHGKPALNRRQQLTGSHKHGLGSVGRTGYQPLCSCDRRLRSIIRVAGSADNAGSGDLLCSTHIRTSSTAIPPSIYVGHRFEVGL